MSLSSRGDQILEVNSVNVRHAALSKVHAILSKCPPGPVRLVIGRHPNPKVRFSPCFEYGNVVWLLVRPKSAFIREPIRFSERVYLVRTRYQPVSEAHGKQILDLDFFMV